MKRLFFVGLLACLPLLAGAHGDNFFEYAPDYYKSSRLAASTVETPYQLFTMPISVPLVAFDVWLDNTGSADVITFTLIDVTSGDTQATKTVTLPNLASVAGGSKFHVDWDAEINVTAGRTYALQMASTAGGFGLYYANRLNYLEHNEVYAFDFLYGAARLGDSVQNYTFKYALYKTPTIVSTVTPTSTPSSTPVVPGVISITNARVVSVTDTTALIAWTTNIAADSRAAVRLQYDPLYITNSAFDPTLELEHTLTVTGLYPLANYFVDVFSSAEGQLLLTTYTIGFQTAPKSTSTPSAPTSTTPATPPPTTPTSTPTSTTTPPSATPTSTTPPTNNPGNNQSSNQVANGSSTQSGIDVGEGTESGNTEFSWNPPAGGEPSNGYRIDIFDSDRTLERQINVPAGTHIKEVPELQTGVHHAIVYANNGGVFTKVAAQVQFFIKPQTGWTIFLIITISLLWIGAIAGYLIWKFKKESVAMPVDVGYEVK